MSPTPAEVREQTAEVQTYLRSCCPVCLVPHDRETHEATLRVRIGVMLPPFAAPASSKAALIRNCITCGVQIELSSDSYSTNAKYCMACGEKARRRAIARANVKSAQTKKSEAATRRGNRTDQGR